MSAREVNPILMTGLRLAPVCAAISGLFNNPIAVLNRRASPLPSDEPRGDLSMFIHETHANSDLDAFRAEVRDFCTRELAPETRSKMTLGQHLTREERDVWMKALGAKGWLAGKWPKEYGGLGWSHAQAAAFKEELGKAGTPTLVPFGVTMVGPVIYTFGTPAQKSRYLPAIVRNDTWWCQGYSEPGAGSDLASLRTRAVRDDDHYVVNGHKIWTSVAHWADMIFCLVRTDPQAKKQAGISCLLIDMKTPGITVKPIVSIDLSHHVNEVFFEDVRVPVDNLVGEENMGWTYAKFLLAHERVGVADIGTYRRYLGYLDDVLHETREGGVPLAEQPTYRARKVELEAQLAMLEALLADQHATVAQASAPSLMGAAALKIRGTELQQAILETTMDVLARHGMAYQTDALLAGWNGDRIGPAQSAGLINEHLIRRAATIYGGSSEVQRSILAKGGLGL